MTEEERQEKRRAYLQQYREKNREKMRAYQRQWYSTHHVPTGRKPGRQKSVFRTEEERKKINRERRAKWCRENREKHLAIVHRSMEKNKVKLKERRRAHYLKNREKEIKSVLVRARKLQDENPEVVREGRRKFYHRNKERLLVEMKTKRSTPMGALNSRMHTMIYVCLRSGKAGKTWTSFC